METKEDRSCSLEATLGRRVSILLYPAIEEPRGTSGRARGTGEKIPGAPAFFSPCLPPPPCEVAFWVPEPPQVLRTSRGDSTASNGRGSSSKKTEKRGPPPFFYSTFSALLTSCPTGKRFGRPPNPQKPPPPTFVPRRVVKTWHRRTSRKTSQRNRRLPRQTSTLRGRQSALPTRGGSSRASSTF